MRNKNNPVGWFEIPVVNMDRAKAFYESIFEIEMPVQTMDDNMMAWFPCDNTKLGSCGSLVKMKDYIPSRDGVVIYFTVLNLEVVLDKVNENGGEVLVSRTSIGQYGFVAFFIDSEGNKIGLHTRENL
ncbi:VOC family protein [bacterium]|nr:VOC family protein [bacterium]